MANESMSVFTWLYLVLKETVIYGGAVAALWENKRLIVGCASLRNRESRGAVKSMLVYVSKLRYCEVWDVKEFANWDWELPAFGCLIQHGWDIFERWEVADLWLPYRIPHLAAERWSASSMLLRGHKNPDKNWLATLGQSGWR